MRRDRSRVITVAPVFLSGMMSRTGPDPWRALEVQQSFHIGQGLAAYSCLRASCGAMPAARLAGTYVARALTARTANGTPT